MSEFLKNEAERFVFITPEDRLIVGRVAELTEEADRTGKILLLRGEESYDAKRIREFAEGKTSQGTVARDDDAAFRENLAAIAAGKLRVV
jgi:hypothetical protein